MIPRYVVSAALRLTVLSSGRLAAADSMSRTPRELGSEALPILLAFARPASIDEALASVRRDHDMDREAFVGFVEKLTEQNFLTAADAAQVSIGGFAALDVHLRMLRDVYRVLAYKMAINRHVQGKSVLEIGCGTGVLSLFAAKAGARSVVAIEETSIADVAEHMFERNGANIDLRRGNSRDVTLDEPAEVLIHELLSNDPLGEDLLPILADARRRLLAPGGRMIPSRLQIACVGFHVDDTPWLGVREATRRAHELDALYGLDFSAFAEAIEDGSPSAFGRLPPHFESGDLSQHLLTDECIVADIDLQHELEESPFAASPALRVERAGRLGGVLLYFRAHLDEETQLTNSPFVQTTHWRHWPLMFRQVREVAVGDVVPLRVKLTEALTGQSLAIELL